ncbi:MAG: Type 1 glutamine amidotransferase-like domain-containing protein [Woeseiaceae bacterium]|nr:Type 1 glutamine amidotransferase-like domain-containing protein [Woeseiaceae bacterium]
MTRAATTHLLLGPQSPVRNIGEALAQADLGDGPLAIISAGWQEAEGDVGDVATLVGRPLEDLGLYRRSEELMQGVAGLAAANRRRQDRLVEQQRLYRLRLKQLSIAARHTLAAEGDADMIAAEQRHAIAQLRALDRHHLHRSESIWSEFRDAFDPASHTELARHAAEIAAIIDRSAGVIITGGNVAVLINRLRLFGMDRVLATCNIVAWSAGAMALADRVVLYHDRSPEGRRDPEVFGAGCGIVPGYVLLPDSEHRLRSSERRRMSLLSRRFSPDACVTLDNGSVLRIVDGRVRAVAAVRHLRHDGRLTGLRAA